MINRLLTNNRSASNSEVYCYIVLAVLLYLDQISGSATSLVGLSSSSHALSACGRETLPMTKLSDHIPMQWQDVHVSCTNPRCSVFSSLCVSFVTSLSW
jgi:hypothetical protein